MPDHDSTPPEMPSPFDSATFGSEIAQRDTSPNVASDEHSWTALTKEERLLQFHYNREQLKHYSPFPAIRWVLHEHKFYWLHVVR